LTERPTSSSLRGVDTETTAAAERRSRLATHVTSIDTLVGAHPDSLREIYERGEPATVDALGERPRGRLLTLVPTGAFHLLVRPLIQLLSTTFMPWEGIVFDHGGNGGANIVMGRETLRFRAERVASVIDGAPTLALTYPAMGWLRDEIRMVHEGIGLGVTFVHVAGRDVPIAWFGFSA
jgi:hypothetical protein